MIPLLSALLSGILFALALPPTNWEGLGWVALAPLLGAAAGRRPLEAFGLGMLTGLAAGALLVGWSRDTERLFWGWYPFLALAVLFGLAALLASRLKPGPRGVLTLACAGVVVEYLTTWTPLPLNIALTQYRQIVLIQVSALTGLWGVSFLLWLANAAVADAWRQRRLWTAPLGVALALTVLAVGDGWVTLRATPRSDAVRVAAIQDFSGAETGDFAPQPAQDVDRETMTRQAAAQGAQIVVWSEECLGTGFDPTSDRDSTLALARAVQTALVVGYSDEARPRPHNCAAFVTPQGAVAGVHHKVHLYLGERQAVQAGSERTAAAFPTPLGRVGLEICFDSCWTGVTRRLAATGARLIAMPNYDPPTPHGVLHRLHGAMLPFRAVENGVPFVRADSNGLSQIIDAHGLVVAQGPLYRPAIVAAAVTLGNGRGTPFTRAGDWLPWLCVIVLAGLLRAEHWRTDRV